MVVETTVFVIMFVVLVMSLFFVGVTASDNVDLQRKLDWYKRIVQTNRTNQERVQHRSRQLSSHLSRFRQNLVELRICGRGYQQVG